MNTQNAQISHGYAATIRFTTFATDVGYEEKPMYIISISVYSSHAPTAARLTSFYGVNEGGN